MKKERAAQKERREATEKELFGVQTHIFMSHTVLDRLGVRIGKERIPTRSWLAPYWVSWAI